MLTSNLDAVAPMLCIILGALAAMAAEAFRRKGERMPIGWFGVIVLAGAALSAVFLWDRNLVAFDVIVADNFGLFVTLVLVVVGLLTNRPKLSATMTSKATRLRSQRNTAESATPAS